MSRDPTVFIVDDDEPMRDSLGALLRAHGFNTELYCSGPAFLSSFDDGRPGCLLLDIRMPGMDGLTLQQILAERGAHLPVIIMTAHGDVPTAVRAVRAGALDFLEKPFTEEALLNAIGSAFDKDRQIRAISADADDVKQRAGSLTPREAEVFARLIVGKPNKVIARELGISPRTAEIHRARVMHKMRAENLSHLVRMAMTANIPEPSG